MHAITRLLLLILVTNTARIHAMEDSCSPAERSFLRMEEKYGDFLQTPQFQKYEQAKKLHEKHNTQETSALLEEAAGQLLETKESQLFIQTVAQKRTETKNIVNNAITKNLAVIKTPAYIQYQAAKASHEQYNTADTLYILNICKNDLFNTKEWKEFKPSTEQEMHVIENFAKSQNYLHAQKATCRSALFQYHWNMGELKFAKKVQDNKDAAWFAVTKTKEYQLFKQAGMDHKKYNTPSSLTELKQCRHAAKATNAYFNFCKASEEKRQVHAKIKGYIEPITVIEFRHDHYLHDRCLYDYVYNEKMIKKLNLRI